MVIDISRYIKGSSVITLILDRRSLRTTQSEDKYKIVAADF